MIKIVSSACEHFPLEFGTQYAERLSPALLGRVLSLSDAELKQWKKDDTDVVASQVSEAFTCRFIDAKQKLNIAKSGPCRCSTYSPIMAL